MRNPFIDDCGVTFLGAVTIIGGGILALIAACMGGVYWSESSKCDSINRLTGETTFVSLSTGCLVMHNGRLLSGDTVLTNQIEVTK